MNRYECIHHCIHYDLANDRCRVSLDDGKLECDILRRESENEPLPFIPKVKEKGHKEMKEIYLIISTPVFFVIKIILKIFLTIFLIGVELGALILLGMMMILSFLFTRNVVEGVEEICLYKGTFKLIISVLIGFIIAFWVGDPDGILENNI